MHWEEQSHSWHRNDEKQRQKSKWYSPQIWKNPNSEQRMWYLHPWRWSRHCWARTNPGLAALTQETHGLHKSFCTVVCMILSRTPVALHFYNAAVLHLGSQESFPEKKGWFECTHLLTLPWLSQPPCPWWPRCLGAAGSEQGTWLLAFHWAARLWCGGLRGVVLHTKAVCSKCLAVGRKNRTWENYSVSAGEEKW